MATIINNPDRGGDSGSGAGLIVGIVLAIIIIFAFVVYGIPAMRRQSAGTTVNVPDKINVDVNKTQ